MAVSNRSSKSWVQPFPLRRRVPRGRMVLVLAMGCLMFAGCGATPGRFGDAAREAAMQPFRDMGFVRPVVPPTLERIIDPMAPPMGPGCAWLAYEVASLDVVLGPEASLQPEDAPDLISIQSVTAAAEDAVRGAGAGVLPGRGLVRRVSGAEAAEDRRNQATDRGRMRRAYLVGIQRSRNCAPPANPQPSTSSGR
jgi:hypothetical protein